MAKNSYRAKPQVQTEGELKPIENISINSEIGKEENNTKPTVLYKVQITHPSLRRRAKPTTDGEILGLITDQGQYKIFEEKAGWGRLEDNSWIMLKYSSKIKE